MALMFKATGSGDCNLGGIDTAEVRRALALLADPDKQVEFRAFATSGASVSRVCSGADLDGMVSAVRSLADYRDIYLCLNPVKLASKTASASDADVVYRRWLFIDTDAIRKGIEKGTGKHCATAQEKEDARQCMEGVREYLSDLGFPEPLIQDSGNGFYPLYRIDLPNDDESRDLIRGFLSALAGQFPGAKIDKCVFNASRLARVAGTWNKKGNSTPTRPHRLSRLIFVPETITLVSRDLIARVAGEVQPRPRPKRARVGESQWFKTQISSSRLAAYVRGALRNVCHEVGNAISGENGGEGRNNALNNAAFAMGQLDHYGVVPEEEIIKALVGAADECGLNSDDGIEQTIRTINSGLNGGRKYPREPPKDSPAWTEKKKQADKRQEEKQGQPEGVRWEIDLDGEIIAEGDPDEVVAQHGGELGDGSGHIRRFSLNTLGHIARTQFPPPVWVIPGIMSEGLNILAGAPKAGKSVLALNLALTVAGGGLALGDTRVRAADVLYLSLEDQLRRVKGRAVKMLSSMNEDLYRAAHENLIVTTDWPRQDDGGLELIELWSKRARNPGLLIIDVWNRFSPQYKQSGSTYNQDAQFMSDVKKFVERRGFSVLIVHHTRKPSPGASGSDFLAEVSGTMGLTGTADGVIVLSRSRQEKTAMLNITGRDVSEKELVLEFTEKTLTWKSLGTKDAFVEGDVQSRVLAYLKHISPGCAHNGPIAEELKLNQDSVKTATRRMADKGIIQKRGNAYAWPGNPPDEVEF